MCQKRSNGHVQSQQDVVICEHEHPCSFFWRIGLADPASKDLLLSQLGQLFDSPLYEALQVSLTLFWFRGLEFASRDPSWLDAERASQE